MLECVFVFFYVCFLLMLKKTNNKKEEKRIRCFNLYMVMYFKDK
jgi:hypothetical protein